MWHYLSRKQSCHTLNMHNIEYVTCYNGIFKSSGLRQFQGGSLWTLPMLKTKYFLRIICLADTYCLLFEVSGRIYTIISRHLAKLW